MKRLVERFDQQLDQVRSPEYNETQLRIDFVNPMFAELGWDIDNRQGYAEQYREVVHEDRIRIAGESKAPDYSFRVGGTRKFFLEAKKPFVNIKENVEAAYQLRRYAWSAKLAASILTDFEEFAVYDTRIRPKHLEKASTARREYFTYQQYDEKWDFLAGTFSKDAVLRGDFDRYCGSTRGRGAQEFDDAFLQEIEGWRKTLAKNLALRNESLDERDINFAVQRIIDRIIFLRICEGRGIERTDRLRALVNGDRVYARLFELFRAADDRYNSGLFHFNKEKDREEEPDELTPGLDIDDSVLKSIIKSLYYPESPYEFTVVSADILGSVYERFLGKVIAVSPGHRVHIDEKPEVRKAGGVYYTPTYIVEYIVQQTVGKLLEGKSPRDAAKLKVLDPACGSGSFLIGAYQHLLDWHLDWYTNNDPASHARGKNAVLRPGKTDDWRLTINERKRILLNNIYGVDIDYQAVEVTKLSLLLKVLEGETAETLGGLWTVSHERALPDLGNNVKCGNSLIGTDIIATEAWQEMSEDERRRVNPFDFANAFASTFKQGGFDAVLGNPPWGQKDIAKGKAIIAYLRRRFPSIAGIFDLFRPFIELATELTRPDGLIGQVLPDIILLKNYQSTRALLLERTALEGIEWWGMAFNDAIIDAVTLVAKRGSPPARHDVNVAVHDPESPIRHVLRQEDFARNPRQTFNLLLTDERRALLDGLSQFPRLGEFFEIHEGVHSGNIREALFVCEAVDESCKPLVFGRDEIAPYRLAWHGKYIRLSAMPPHRSARRYANVGNPEWHSKPKILVRRTGDFVMACVDEHGYYASNNFFLVIPKGPHPLDLFGACALLNSRIMTDIFRIVEPRQGRVFAELKIKHLVDFPMPPTDDPRIRSLNEAGSRRVSLAKEISQCRLPHELERKRREEEALDREINRLVSEVLELMGSECIHL